MSIVLETGTSVATRGRFLVFSLNSPNMGHYKARFNKTGAIQLFHEGKLLFTLDNRLRDKTNPELCHFVDVLLKFKPLVMKWIGNEGKEDVQRDMEAALHDMMSKTKSLHEESEEVQNSYY